MVAAFKGQIQIWRIKSKLFGAQICSHGDSFPLILSLIRQMNQQMQFYNFCFQLYPHLCINLSVFANCIRWTKKSTHREKITLALQPPSSPKNYDGYFFWVHPIYVHKKSYNLKWMWRWSSFTLHSLFGSMETNLWRWSDFVLCIKYLAFKEAVVALFWHFSKMA